MKSFEVSACGLAGVGRVALRWPPRCVGEQINEFAQKSKAKKRRVQWSRANLETNAATDARQLARRDAMISPRLYGPTFSSPLALSPQRNDVRLSPPDITTQSPGKDILC